MEGQKGPAPPSSSSFNKSEESGWTQYLVDFSSDQRDIQKSSFSCDFNGGPSMLSDAASPSQEIIACSTTMSGGLGHGQQQLIPKKLKVKKQRTKKYYYDDLEDTASSPVNSPKVSDSKHDDMMDDGNGTFQGEKNCTPVALFQSDERSSIIIDGKNNREEDCRDLKKKGLCLVPFSMLVNYLR